MTSSNLVAATKCWVNGAEQLFGIQSQLIKSLLVCKKHHFKALYKLVNGNESNEFVVLYHIFLFSEMWMYWKILISKETLLSEYHGIELDIYNSGIANLLTPISIFKMS